MAETAEWVFESMLQYFRSPLWTTPVLGFIETHCSEFTPDEEEHRLEHTALHRDFCTLVDGLLSAFLSDLGVPAEEFMEACQSGRHTELSDMVTEYLVAIDDFRSFRAMMERHNHALELEAMCEHASITSAAAAAAGDDDMDDEERFLLEMAIKASLTPDDIDTKRQEVQDAELLQALALSVAAEHERLVQEQLNEATAAADAEAAKAAAARAEAESEEKVRQLHEACLQQRVQNAATKPASPAPGLAPLQVPGAGGGHNAAFGAERFKPLPSIAPGADPVAAQPTPAAQPKFEELKQRAQPAPAQATPSGPSADEIAQRAAYLKAQREKLLKQKQAQRELELAEYTSKKGAKPAEPEAPVVDDSHKAMRSAIARRFKEDLLEETRKQPNNGVDPCGRL